MVEILAAKGAKTVALDKAPRSEHGKETLYVQADVTDEGSLMEASSIVREKLGHVT